MPSSVDRKNENGERHNVLVHRGLDSSSSDSGDDFNIWEEGENQSSKEDTQKRDDSFKTDKSMKNSNKN